MNESIITIILLIVVLIIFIWNIKRKISKDNHNLNQLALANKLEKLLSILNEYYFENNGIVSTGEGLYKNTVTLHLINKPIVIKIQLFRQKLTIVSSHNGVNISKLSIDNPYKTLNNESQEKLAQIVIEENTLKNIK